MGKRAVFLVSLVIGLVLFFYFSHAMAKSPGITKDTILVGLIGPMTGPASWAGTSVQNSALLYFDEVNQAGGVNGRKIKVIVEDDEALPSKSIAAARKLIDRDNVFCLFGGVSANAFVGIFPLLKETGIPYHCVLVSHPSVTIPTTKNIFRVGSIPLTSQSYYMVDFAIQQFKPKKMAIVNQSDEFGKTGAQYLLERMDKKYQIKPVAHEVYNLGEVDFTSQVVRLKNANTDVALIYGYPKEVAILFRQSKELGLNIQWVGAISTADRSFTLLAGEAAVGSVHLWSWGPYLETDDNPILNQFKEKYAKKYPGAPPGKPNALDMAAYASARVFVEGLRRAGNDPTHEGFIKVMESIQNFDSGLLGKVTFSPQDHQGNKAARFVINQAGGKRALIGVIMGAE